MINQCDVCFYPSKIHATAWKIVQGLIHLRVRRRMRKLTTGLLLASMQIDIPIRIMRGVHMRMIVQTKVKRVVHHT
jgi:hypothetical protein